MNRETFPNYGGTEPAALEFLDGFTIGSISESNGLGMSAKPTLFMEFNAAHVSALESVLNIVQETCRETGASSIKTTTETLVRRHPSQKMYISDVAIPMSAYP